MIGDREDAAPIPPQVVGIRTFTARQERADLFRGSLNCLHHWTLIGLPSGNWYSAIATGRRNGSLQLIVTVIDMVVPPVSRRHSTRKLIPVLLGRLGTTRSTAFPARAV